MRSFVSAAIVAAAFVICAEQASAQSRPITEYCTAISENDKSASDGYRLKDAASILRQDRANYHKFGYRDRGDESDSYFKSASNRALIPGLLESGNTEPSVLRQIVRGTPRVCVSVYRGWMEVVLE